VTSSCSPHKGVVNDLIETKHSWHPGMLTHEIIESCFIMEMDGVMS
jgi:hypothetical protein